MKTATDQASKDGVTGTPTVFVDGTKLADLSAGGLTAAVAGGAGGLTPRDHGAATTAPGSGVVLAPWSS